MGNGGANRERPDDARPEYKVLNLGCGRKRLAGALNLDFRPSIAADMVHDLDSMPWPLPDNQFDTVVMQDSLEHLRDVVAVMEEVHRVCVNGALVRIATPHFSSSNSFTDPTHLHHFGYFSFDYFTGDHEFDFYTGRRFRRRKVEIVFHPTPANRLIWRIANRYPRGYERRWAWIFPAWFLSVELEAVK